MKIGVALEKGWIDGRLEVHIEVQGVQMAAGVTIVAREESPSSTRAGCWVVPRRGVRDGLLDGKCNRK